jgi:tousled-like kinase
MDSGASPWSVPCPSDGPPAPFRDDPVAEAPSPPPASHDEVPTGRPSLDDPLARERREKEHLQAVLRRRDAELEQCRGRLLKLREALTDSLRRACAAERDRDRQEAHDRAFSLGQVLVQRDMSEVWCDGKLLRDTRAKLDRIREEADQAKRQWQERKKEEKRKGKPTPEEDDGVDEEEAASLLLLQTHLQREEAAIVQQLEDLDTQKHLFIKDVKRLRSEEASKFNGCPILNDRYLLGRLLGKGGFSEVFKAFDLVEGRSVACKIHQLNAAWGEERRHSYVRHARREYDIHRTLVHPRVIQLHDMFEIDGQTFATVLEYCDGTDLDGYLKKHKWLGEKEAKGIMQQVFSGLRYLNERPEPIIHYDLKPGNILVSSGLKVKITDFGLSKILPSQEETHIDLTSQGAGTYWYLPPECFETAAIPKISAKVDVWGAAVVFYQLLFGRKPFGNDVSQHQLVLDRVILNARSVDFPAKPAVSPETKDFIRRLLCYNPAERPDIFAVCADPYFTAKAPGRRKSAAASAPKDAP